MADLYRDYLTLLSNLQAGLEKLCTLSQEVMNAVQNDDLIALDKVMRQQQVMTLSFRGMEQNRQKLLKQLGLEQIPLSALPNYFPSELQSEARQNVQILQEQYRQYGVRSQQAQSFLETNIHEIEHFIREFGGAVPSSAAPGYADPVSEPPKSMRTDFRA